MKENEVPDGKILIVDDTPLNLKVLRDFLNKKNYSIFCAVNGEDAIKIAIERSPDIILMNALMCGIDGFTTCQRIKNNQKTSAIPVIFMTALNNSDSKIKGFEAGAVDVITKPFNIQEVHLRIKAHLKTCRLLKRQKANIEFKTKVLAMASHELRRPLTIIGLQSQLWELHRKQEISDKEKKFSKTILDAVKSASNLLNEFIMIGKSDLNRMTVNKSLFDVTKLCKQIIHENTIVFENKCTIIQKFDNRNKALFTDQQLLHYILTNLISNAIKYSPDGGDITLEYFQKKSAAYFTIKDHGIGIPEQDQHRLFKDFNRATNVGQISGTGLGLALSKRFVGLLNGTISFTSKNGAGSTFKVIIPVEESKRRVNVNFPPQLSLKSRSSLTERTYEPILQ